MVQVSNKQTMCWSVESAASAVVLRSGGIYNCIGLVTMVTTQGWCTLTLLRESSWVSIHDLLNTHTQAPNALTPNNQSPFTTRTPGISGQGQRLTTPLTVCVCVCVPLSSSLLSCVGQFSSGRRLVRVCIVPSVEGNSPPTSQYVYTNTYTHTYSIIIMTLASKRWRYTGIEHCFLIERYPMLHKLLRHKLYIYQMLRKLQRHNINQAVFTRCYVSSSVTI